MKEEELAAHIVNWLTDQHYEVYQEVKYRSGIADIVVDINGRGWVIETKTSFGLAVIGQAYDFRRFGITRVSVGTPKPKNASKGYHMAYDICSKYGIGIIEVDKRGRTKEHICPSFIRSKKKADIIDICEEQHKIYCKAGTKGGGYWTPYKRTIDRVRDFIRGKGWVRFQNIMECIDHHYSSTSTAKACLSKNLQSIHKDEFESRMNGRYLEFRFIKSLEGK